MTDETWEAEFVAYNGFRAACGASLVTRETFRKTVARHNATIAPKSPEDQAAWDQMEREAAEYDREKQA